MVRVCLAIKWNAATDMGIWVQVDITQECVCMCVCVWSSMKIYPVYRFMPHIWIHVATTQIKMQDYSFTRKELPVSTPFQPSFPSVVLI